MTKDSLPYPAESTRRCENKDFLQGSKGNARNKATLSRPFVLTSGHPGYGHESVFDYKTYR